MVSYDLRMRRARKHLPKAIALLAVIALVIAGALLESIGITKDISAAVFLGVGFTGMIVHRALVLRKPLDLVDLLLAAPVCLIFTLVALKETGVVGLPSIAIWVTGAILFILAIGYTSPPDDRENAAP